MDTHTLTSTATALLLAISAAVALYGAGCLVKPFVVSGAQGRLMAWVFWTVPGLIAFAAAAIWLAGQVR